MSHHDEVEIAQSSSAIQMENVAAKLKLIVSELKDAHDCSNILSEHNRIDDAIESVDLAIEMLRANVTDDPRHEYWQEQEQYNSPMSRGC